MNNWQSDISAALQSNARRFYIELISLTLVTILYLILLASGYSAAWGIASCLSLFVARIARFIHAQLLLIKTREIQAMHENEFTIYTGILYRAMALLFTALSVVCFGLFLWGIR